jgi:hypothetical protein
MTTTLREFCVFYGSYSYFLEVLTMNRQRVICFVLLIMGLGNNIVVAQHSDLELFDDAGRVGVEPRIAEGEFGESPNPAYRADEPGLESDPNELTMHGETPLPGGALVGFDVALFTLGSSTKSLFYWNGLGSPDFVSLTSPHELKISDAGESFSLQFDGSGSVPDFNFAVTADGSGPDLAGFLHHDLNFDLVDAGGTGVGSPAAGVYAFATTFRVTGLAASDPVYWVLASGIEEAVHEAAIDFIARSVGIVPEPTSLGLAGGALVLGLLRRSRGK